MKYDEFHKLIEEQNPEKKQFLFKCAMDGLSLPVESTSTATAAAAQKPKNKWRSSFKHSFKNFFKTPARLAACVSAAVAVACLAIILPFTLSRDGGLQATTPSTSDNPSTPNDRFCVATACKEIELKYPLKEYAARNRLSILYLDWYDVADIKTSMHVSEEDSTDIVYYEEILKHKYTGSIAEFYITNLRTHVDKLEDYKKPCQFIYITKPTYTKVYLGYDVDENGEHNTHQAYFKYGKYEYVLVLRYPMNHNDIFELIDSILPTIKR